MIVTHLSPGGCYAVATVSLIQLQAALVVRLMSRELENSRLPRDLVGTFFDLVRVN